MTTTRIQVDEYIAQWARGKYLDPVLSVVRFPAHTDIYEKIYEVMSRRPRNASPVDRGNLEIALPDKRDANHAFGKPPEHFNYISAHGSSVLNKRLKCMFWAEVHEAMDEGKHIAGIDYQETAWQFLQRYNITAISDDAIKKNYQRWRDKLRRTRRRGYETQKKR